MKKLFSFLFVFILVACSKDPVIYTLTATANPSEGGSVSPSSQQYDSGDVATITATPSSEYVFQSWSGSFTSYIVQKYRFHFFNKFIHLNNKYYSFFDWLL